MLIVSALGSMPFGAYSLISYGSYVLPNRHSRSFEVSLRLCEDPWPPDIDPPPSCQTRSAPDINESDATGISTSAWSFSLREGAYAQACLHREHSHGVSQARARSDVSMQRVDRTAR